MRVPAGPTDWSGRTRTRRPRGKSAVDSDVWSTPWEVTPSMPDHASTSGPTMCPTGSTLQITRRDRRPRWTISPLPLNAERTLPRSTVLVATATIRVVATEGQIYGRQLQQQATTRARIGILFWDDGAWSRTGTPSTAELSALLASTHTHGA